MPKTPKTYEDLRTDIGLPERAALTVAAVLPNLPDDESLIVLRGATRLTTGRRYWETDEDVIDDFKRRHDPVCPGSDVYRVRAEEADAPGNKVEVTPVPHGFRSYHITGYDFTKLVSLNTEDCSFDDTPQSTLTDFGTTSPYFSAGYKLTGDYDRKPSLPV